MATYKMNFISDKDAFGYRNIGITINFSDKSGAHKVSKQIVTSNLQNEALRARLQAYANAYESNYDGCFS